MARSDQRISYYNSSHTRIELQAFDAWGAGPLLGGRIVAWCHQRLYPLLFAFCSQAKLRWIVLIVVRFKIVPS